MRAAERIAPRGADEIRQAIAEADGNEVFLVGELDEDGRVASIRVGARGSAEAVPVLFPQIRDGDCIIHNHPSGGLSPSGADLSIASRLGNQGIGFAIVDNDVEEVYVVAEAVRAREASPLDRDELARALEPGGALGRIFPQYEMRESQVGMLRAVCDSFNGDEICAAEAGTGVGKSLAYLLPAVAWAQSNGERVVVSTNTINLQQQLVEKDIPLVKRVLGADTKVVLVKGRGNYLCQVRLAEALEEASLFEDRDPDLLAVQEWARTTETGSRTDLSFYPSDELWSRVCSEADACQGLRCRYREGCFVLRARREAASARVLVANHHLLFADLAFRMAGSGFDDPAVLPPFKRIIFDEAHNVEKAATSFFSQSFSRFLVQRFLGRLYRRRRGRVTGSFPALAKLLGRSSLSKKIPLLIADVQEKADALDSACLSLVGEEAGLLLDAQSLPRLADAAGGLLAGLSASIRGLDAAFAEAFDKAGEKTLSAEEQSVVWECKVQVSRLNGIADICDRFRAGEPGPNDIFWMEAARGSKAERAARLVITPLAIGPLMREAVFEPFKTVVLTSATLTVAGSFSYWAGRIGLSGRGSAGVGGSAGGGGREPVLCTFPSPFNYRENVLLGVPTDAPAPGTGGYSGFLSRFISQALLASHGAGLVLFTSYALLRETADAVRPVLAEAGIRLMRQGEGDRARLLDAFRQETSSVLFATDSFWEGVDAPGQTLQVVVLCRLPFRVPTEPVLRARMAAIEQDGGNPFAELSLPDAVVRMRQGFGRLMRRHDDQGVVLVLDSRIVTKQYGEVFLDSLPATRRAIGPASEVLSAVRDFFC
jgi:ATP-dependent DNA helicase DinG